MMEISAKDRELLRSLADRYMTYAMSEQNIEKRRLWLKHNSLKSERPMITMEQLPWGEMDVDGFLQCHAENSYLRGIENELRMQIYKWEHMPADMVLNPYIVRSRAIGNTGYGVNTQVEYLGLSQRFTDQFTEPEDVQKIKDPIITLNREADEEYQQICDYVFDGIAETKLGGFVMHCGLWDSITCWRSAENCYIDLMDRPEFMHAIMGRLTDAAIAMVKQINELGLYDLNTNMCHCSYTFDNNLPAENCDYTHPTTHDGWAFGLAQLFSSVSPDITAEFEVPYMQKLFPYFGAIYYGCCDRLDDRLYLIDRLPNVRKVSCSPWSNREHFAECLPDKYIMSAKPTPAFLAYDEFDENAIRADLRRTMEAAKSNGKCLEFLLKDVSTIRNKPERLWRWSEIALEEVQNW